MRNFFTEGDVPDQWQAGDNLLDLYQVKEVIDKGGMGIIYVVRYRSWNADLAVKSPRQEYFRSEEDRVRFVGEAETWINLGLHPNIVSSYYVRVFAGVPRIFAEYVSGGSLADWTECKKLYADGPESALQRILDIGIQTAWGLAHAHENQVPHHDMKPSNVMMTDVGIPKVTDFGLSRAITSLERASGVSDPDRTQGHSLFTPAYCSPEQAASAQLPRTRAPALVSDDFSYKTDIWSWGLTLLSMFKGGTTWQEGQRAPLILADYMSSATPSAEIPVMPEALAELLRQCFETNAEDRPTMVQIAQCMVEIYGEAMCRTYPRRQPKAPDWRASNLNNRALSFYALGKKGDAIEEWEHALKIDAAHPEVNYNLGLAQWRDGRIIDLGLIDTCREVVKSHKGDWLPVWLLSQVHLERGDCQGAVEVLDTLGGTSDDNPDVVDTYKRAKDSLIAAPRCLRTLAKLDNEKIMEVLPAIFPTILSRPEMSAMLAEIQQAQESGKDITSLARSFLKQLAPYVPFHAGAIWTVDVNRDWTHALSGSDDKTMKLWDINTGECVRTFTGHSNTVRCVRFGHDESYVVSGSWDNTIRVWRTSSGECLQTLEGHTDAVNALDVSADGEYILSGSNDRTLKLWERVRGSCARVFRGHTSRVTAACLTPDNRYVVSGSDDKTVRVWDRETGTCVGIPATHEGSINSICLDPRLRALSASTDRTLKMWNIPTSPSSSQSAESPKTLVGDRNAVTAVAMTKDGRFAVAGSWDKTVKLWSLLGDRGRCLRSFEGHEAGVTSVQVSPGGDYAISGGSDASLRLWSLAPKYRYEAPFAVARPPSSETAMTTDEAYHLALAKARQAFDEDAPSTAMNQLREARREPGYERDPEALLLWQGLYLRLRPTRLRDAWHAAVINEKPVESMSISLSAQAQRVLSGNIDNTACLWDIEKGKLVHVLTGHGDPVTSVCLSTNGHYALTGSWDRTVRLWDARTAKCLRVFSGHRKPVMSVCLSSDGRFALSGSWDNTVRLWDTASGRSLGTLTGHERQVNAVCLDGRNLYALSGGIEGDIRLWSLEDGSCIRTLQQGEMVHAVEFSQIGFRAFSADAGNCVIEWDLILGNRRRTFEGHGNRVFSLSLGLGDRFLLTGSRDKTLKMWDTATGECLRTFGGHESEVSSARLSSDGRCAVSTGSDHMIRVWDLDWELEYRAPTDWDDGALPYVQSFLDSRARRGLFRRWRRPRWSDKDWEDLLYTLRCAGYGSLRPDGVRRQLRDMARTWKGPTVGL